MCIRDSLEARRGRGSGMRFSRAGALGAPLRGISQTSCRRGGFFVCLTFEDFASRQVLRRPRLPKR
eukprot:1934912-Pyramimonas_sp.AAC.1